MIKHIKNAIFSIAFAFTLLVTGCSSTENASSSAERSRSATDRAAPSAEINQSAPASPAVIEEQAHDEAIEKKERLKKQKATDDDMERLD